MPHFVMKCNTAPNSISYAPSFISMHKHVKYSRNQRRWGDVGAIEAPMRQIYGKKVRQRQKYVWMIPTLIRNWTKQKKCWGKLPLSVCESVVTAPLTTLRSSNGRDTGLGCRASGYLASHHCSTCCGRSGWFRRGGTARSGLSGFENQGCRRIWDSAPIPLRSTWTIQSEETTEDGSVRIVQTRTKSLTTNCILHRNNLLKIHLSSSSFILQALISALCAIGACFEISYDWVWGQSHV